MVRSKSKSAPLERFFTWQSYNASLLLTDQMHMIDAAQLRELSSRRLQSQALQCDCKPVQFPAWESMTYERWPDSLQQVATLQAPDVDEPTVEEFHPNGTRYDSADAPVAVQWFPFNRSDVYVCSNCQSVFLRYTEFGGYYVDKRVRMVNPELVV